ncbi:MAG: hypothetical protein QME94_20025, partial [Anaerolineae bacterium]|nr:hypothetical protein [Anaerolineae bacterium]
RPDGGSAPPGDELLFTVNDAEARRYAVQFARRDERDEGEIAERNLQIANQAESLLKAAHDAVIVSSLAVRMIGLDAYRHPVPPDPLVTLLHNDPRFVDAGLDLVALADRWPGYPTEAVDYRRLSANVSPAARLQRPGEIEELEEE